MAEVLFITEASACLAFTSNCDFLASVSKHGTRFHLVRKYGRSEPHSRCWCFGRCFPLYIVLLSLVWVKATRFLPLGLAACGSSTCKSPVMLQPSRRIPEARWAKLCRWVVVHFQSSQGAGGSSTAPCAPHTQLPEPWEHLALGPGPVEPPFRKAGCRQRELSGHLRSLQLPTWISLLCRMSWISWLTQEILLARGLFVVLWCNNAALLHYLELILLYGKRFVCK